MGTCCSRCSASESGCSGSAYPVGTGTSFGFCDASSTRALRPDIDSDVANSSEFAPHSVRHTFGTRLGKSGVDAFTIMKLMGRSTIT